MNDTPQAPVSIPNYTNYQPDLELHKLRKRLLDLQRLGAATPETFQQTLMQLWNENERRRQACLQEAEDHLRRYHSLVAQAHAFSAQSSIVYSIINGYVVIEERRAQELADLAKDKTASETPEVPVGVEDQPAIEEPSKDKRKKT